MLLLTIAFIGCFENSNPNPIKNNNPLQGKWIDSKGQKITFFKNGTVHIEPLQGNGTYGIYSIANETVTFVFITQDQNYTTSATFKFPNDNTLNLIYKNGQIETYTKND
jgi:hypothetical protein